MATSYPIFTDPASAKGAAIHGPPAARNAPVTGAPNA
jgi:hypothetical protein